VSISQIGLFVIALLIPIVGFIMTITHARKGESRQEQRWRKSHGLIFWVFLPFLAGLFTLLGMLESLPKLFGIIGIIILGLSTFLSWSIQKKREERT
jgi:hypothetical protein